MSNLTVALRKLADNIDNHPELSERTDQLLSYAEVNLQVTDTDEGIECLLDYANALGLEYREYRDEKHCIFVPSYYQDGLVRVGGIASVDIPKEEWDDATKDKRRVAHLNELTEQQQMIVDIVNILAMHGVTPDKAEDLLTDLSKKFNITPKQEEA